MVLATVAATSASATKQLPSAEDPQCRTTTCRKTRTIPDAQASVLRDGLATTSAIKVAVQTARTSGTMVNLMVAIARTTPTTPGTGLMTTLTAVTRWTTPTTRTHGRTTTCQMTTPCRTTCQMICPNTQLTIPCRKTRWTTPTTRTHG